MSGRAAISVVLDTNILVSAMLSAFGPSARVLDLAVAGEIQLIYDDRILAEYTEVLARPKFGFAADDVAAVLDFIRTEGESIIALSLSNALPDSDDAPFIEVAVQARAMLVTGNTLHYPVTARGTINVLTPAEFLRFWQQRPQSAKPG